MKKGNPFSFVEMELGVWHSTNSTVSIGDIVYSWIHVYFFNYFHQGNLMAQI